MVNGLCTTRRAESDPLVCQIQTGRNKLNLSKAKSKLLRFPSIKSREDTRGEIQTLVKSLRVLPLILTGPGLHIEDFYLKLIAHRLNTK